MVLEVRFIQSLKSLSKINVLGQNVFEHEAQTSLPRKRSGSGRSKEFPLTLTKSTKDSRRDCPKRF